VPKGRGRLSGFRFLYRAQMYAEHIIEVVRRLGGDHALRAQQGFLGVLEKYLQRALSYPCPRHGFGHGQDHGGVRVVAAGVYANFPPVHDVPQGVNVPAYADDGARLLAS
jgi:hypothetical protein